VKATIGLCLVFIVFTSGACCDRQHKRIEPHWLRTTSNRYLALAFIQRPGPVPIGGSEASRSWFENEGIAVEIGTQHYGFWLDVANRTGKPIRMVWPEARYIDEKGSIHEVFSQERGALPDDRENLRSPPAQLVASGGRIRPTIVPIYKQYLVASRCRDLFPYSEPLIPTKLSDKDEQQMKAYVDDLARRQVPVKLLLPIEIDGKRYDYTFTFVLKDRWSDLTRD